LGVQGPWLCATCMEERQQYAERKVVEARAKLLEARGKASKRNLEAMHQRDPPDSRRLSNRQQDTPRRGRGRGVGRGSRPSTGGRGSGSMSRQFNLSISLDCTTVLHT
jgi:hypothetical protein